MLAAANAIFPKHHKCPGTNKSGLSCYRKPFLDFNTCKHHTVLPQSFTPTTREEWLEYKKTHFTSGKPLALELFKGTGSIDKAITRNGHMDVVSFDIDKFYRPDICADFMDFDFWEIFEPGEFLFVWASPVCTSWSLCTNKHRIPMNQDPEMPAKSDTGRLGETMILRLCNLIDYLEPQTWAIENPRGRLRHWKPFKQWLNQSFANQWTPYYGNHGHYLRKATDIWNNASVKEYKHMTKKENSPSKDISFCDISELTLSQRYAMPSMLCDIIANWGYRDGLHKKLMSELEISHIEYANLM